MRILAGKLSEANMSILQAYAFKVNEHLTDEAFAKIPFAFPNEHVPMAKVCRSCLRFLSHLQPRRYGCCFAGEHKDRTKCPYCGQDRYKVDRRGKKKPRKVFSYLPFIPHLVAMYSNAAKAIERQYHAFEHVHMPGQIMDVFDSHIYC